MTGVGGGAADAGLRRRPESRPRSGDPGGACHSAAHRSGRRRCATAFAVAVVGSSPRWRCRRRRADVGRRRRGGGGRGTPTSSSSARSTTTRSTTPTRRRSCGAAAGGAGLRDDPAGREDEVNVLRDEGAGRERDRRGARLARERLAGFRLLCRDPRGGARRRGSSAPGSRGPTCSRAMVEGAAGVFGPDAATYGLDQPLAAEDARRARGRHAGRPLRQAAARDAARHGRGAALPRRRPRRRGALGADDDRRRPGGGDRRHRPRRPAARRSRRARRRRRPTCRCCRSASSRPSPRRRGDYDLVLLAPSPERPDPCAAFEGRGG